MKVSIPGQWTFFTINFLYESKSSHVSDCACLTRRVLVELLAKVDYWGVGISLFNVTQSSFFFKFLLGIFERRRIDNIKKKPQAKGISSSVTPRWANRHRRQSTRTNENSWSQASHFKRGKLLPLIVKPLFLFLYFLIFFFNTDLSHLDSQPDTPMSIESANSDASKLRVKIKVLNVLLVFSSLDTG